MPPFTSGSSVDAKLGLPAFVIALVGLYGAFAFLAIIVIVCLVAIKKCAASHSHASDPLPPKLSSCPHRHYPIPARRGLALPVASVRMCLQCQKSYIKAYSDKAAQLPPGSTLSPLSPSSYYAKRGPTGVPRMQPRGHPSLSPVSASAAPTAPSSPPLGYAARGPTASLRPMVW